MRRLRSKATDLFVGQADAAQVRLHRARNEKRDAGNGAGSGFGLTGWGGVGSRRGWLSG